MAPSDLAPTKLGVPWNVGCVLTFQDIPLFLAQDLLHRRDSENVVKKESDGGPEIFTGAGDNSQRFVLPRDNCTVQKACFRLGEVRAEEVFLVFSSWCKGKELGMEERDKEAEIKSFVCIFPPVTM